jgi:hypothetical protein
MGIKTGVLEPREPAIDLIRIISEGTYTTFAQSLKEFISNAYDADATEVDVTVDEDCNTIVVHDNGVGMTLKEFGDFFASIARSGKSGARTVFGRTNLGRPKIGRFGIGALAVAGVAERMTVKSTKKGSSEGFEAAISLENLRKHFLRGEDLSKHWRFFFNRWDGEPSSLHFSDIRIEGINDDIRALLQRPGQMKLDEFFPSTSKLSGLDELAWQLGIISPVAYAFTYPVEEKHLSRGKDALIMDKARRLLKDRIQIKFNGQPLRRPILLPRYQPNKLADRKEAEMLLKRGIGFEIRYLRSPKGAPVRYEGYVVVQATKLFPEELRGVLIRLRGVAIGWHRTFNISAGVLSTMLPNLSGEIWVEGLEEALQFDRESFREDHPKFRWLKESVIEKINEEEKGFRQRSVKRLSLTKSGSKRAAKKGMRPGDVSTQPTASPIPLPKADADFLPSAIFENVPDHITRILPQINGCWERQYYEACAVMIRRLIETMIIEVYWKRNWDNELKNPETRDFLGLKAIIGKFKADPRFSLDSKINKGLNDLKDIGDIAAHDFRIKVRKSDLEHVRDALRKTSERLIFLVRTISR